MLTEVANMAKTLQARLIRYNHKLFGIIFIGVFAEPVISNVFTVVARNV